MDLFPELRDPIDTCSVGNYFLAAYPNYIVLGAPNKYLCFPSDSYIKIPPRHFVYWYEAICQMLSVDANEKARPLGKDFGIKKFPKFDISWKRNSGDGFVIKIEAPTNTSEFVLELEDIHALAHGLYYLSLKPLLFPQFVDLAIEVLFEDNLQKISQIKNTLSGIEIVGTLGLNLTSSQIATTAAYIIRYKAYLDWKTTFKSFLALDV